MTYVWERIGRGRLRAAGLTLVTGCMLLATVACADDARAEGAATASPPAAVTAMEPDDGLSREATMMFVAAAVGLLIVGTLLAGWQAKLEIPPTETDWL